MRYALAVGMLMLAVSACAGSGHPPTRISPAVKSAGHGRSGGAGGIAAVAALSETDAWAVGVHEPLPRGIYPLTWHWDGKSWTVVPCPSPGGTAHPNRSALVAVAFDAPDDAWAVGSWSPIERHAPRYALIEHWDGAKWSIVPAPRSRGRPAGGLSAVAAISPTAVWAFGGSVVMRWDGTRWRYLPSPPRRGLGTELTGMAVISARDIWVVGTKGVTRFRALAEHWDGSKWTIVPTPYAINGWTKKTILFAVAGSSASNVWAVGWYQSGPDGSDYSTLVEHWDGTRWQVQPSPDGPRSGTESQLFAVAALSRTSALAVGSYGAGTVLPLTERWNGVRWTTVPNKLPPGVTYADLTAIAAVNPRYAWAWGTPFLEKWNGTSWQQVPSPVP